MKLPSVCFFLIFSCGQIIAFQAREFNQLLQLHYLCNASLRGCLCFLHHCWVITPCIFFFKNIFSHFNTISVSTSHTLSNWKWRFPSLSPCNTSTNQQYPCMFCKGYLYPCFLGKPALWELITVLHVLGDHCKLLLYFLLRPSSDFTS
jgi:hypothetical protein